MKHINTTIWDDFAYNTSNPVDQGGFTIGFGTNNLVNALYISTEILKENIEL